MSGIPAWFLSFFGGGAPVTTGAPADANVVITADQMSPKLGDTITFTITTADAGPGDATGLAVTFPLGTNFQYVSSTAAQGSYDSQTGIWSIGSVANGASASLTITATVIGTGWNLLSAQITAASSLDAINSNNASYVGVAVPPAGITTAINTVASSDGTDVPPAVAGAYNQQIVTNQAANATIFLAQGYQSAVLAGTAGAALIDGGQGNALLMGNIGNDTLLAAASGDTLEGGDGDNIMVSFVGTSVMDTWGKSGNNLFWANGATTVSGGTGHDTAVISAGGLVNTGSGGSQIWMSTGSTLINSNGADTIVAGTGAETINVLSSSGVLAFGGAGQMVFNGGAGASTVIGFNASTTITGGAGGGTFFGGTAGHNVISSGSGQANMFGGGDGDVLIATGSADDVLVASSGAETLNASGSSGSNVFFGGFGSDVMIGGTGLNAFSAGPGLMTLVGGGSADLYNFIAGATSQTVIQGFNASNDYIELSGFGGGANTAALSTLKDTAAGATITLSDNTSITFSGIKAAAIQSSNFV